MSNSIHTAPPLWTTSCSGTDTVDGDNSSDTILRKRKFEQVEQASRQTRHRRNSSVSLASDSLLLTPRGSSTYSSLSYFLNHPDRHIVFEHGGHIPHIVISKPEPDHWAEYWAWFNSVRVVDSHLLFPPQALYSPFSLPIIMPSITHRDDEGNYHAQAATRVTTFFPSSPGYPSEWSDPALPLLQHMKHQRGAHIDDSPDPLLFPHIVINEAPPADPYVAYFNSIHEQDFALGQLLVVPAPHTIIPTDPPLDPVEEDEEEDYGYDDIQVSLEDDEYTDQNLYTIHEEDEDEDEDLYDQYTSRPDSPLPQTPPDDDQVDLLPLRLFPDRMIIDSPLTDIEEDPQFMTSSWKLSTILPDKGLPDQYRLEEDDDELPPLDGW